MADWAIRVLVKDEMLVQFSDTGVMHITYKTTEKGIGYLARKTVENVAQSLILTSY